MANKRPKKSQHNKFAEDARKLGLDTNEAEAAFERALGKIVPPKKKSDATGKTPDESLNNKD